MSKLTIIPYNGEGEAVKRGVCTIPSEANIEEVVARISQAISREGVKDIVHVEVKHDCGELIYAFDVRPSEYVQTDGEGSQSFERARYPHKLNSRSNTMDATENTNTELTAEEKKAQKEAERAAKKAEKDAQKAAEKEKREAEKAAKKEAAEAAKAEARAAKGPSKKQSVHDFISETPRTIEEIAEHVGVSTTAARSLINDVKRGGVAVTTAKGEGEDKATRYSAAPSAPAEAE